MNGFLKVKGDTIVLNDEPIVLKGPSLGGWMIMENFINGYPGHEHQLRAGLKDVLGQEKCDFFFEKFLEYWFTEEDAKLYASFGFNSIRLPVNYRHFEDDMKPRVIKEEGYKHLDRVIDICARYGIYSIIDLHCAPGGQNQGWHCDSGISHSTFWDHKDFQDRAINLWEHWAKHYKDNTWVAGSNPLNEPADEKEYRLLDWYNQVEKAIRAIDPNHILFLDGNTYGADFRSFTQTKPLLNSVYACHDYSVYGFPSAPELFKHTPEQIQYHEGNFARKSQFMKDINGPIWVGEFGPVYAFPQDGFDNWQEINESRYQVARSQVDIYRKSKSSWMYEDIGFQGMVSIGAETPWMKLIGPFNERKKTSGVWMIRMSDTFFDPIVNWITETCPGFKDRYPKIWKPTRSVSRLIREQLLSEELLKEYVLLFKDKSKDELEELAKSFLLSNCVQRGTLCSILADDARRAP